MNVSQALWGASPVLVTDLMPLILQHQGHSRVVVGYEILKNNDINLLVFDSGQCVMYATVFPLLISEGSCPNRRDELLFGCLRLQIPLRNHLNG